MSVFCVKICFCIIISAISSFFYVYELSGNLKRKNKIFLNFLCLLATYIFLFLPCYSKNEEVFDIFQIVGEFIVIFIVFDAKIIEKLLAYIKLNIFMGIGTMAGLTWVFLKNGEINDVIVRENIRTMITFYIIVIMIFGVLCMGNMYRKHNKLTKREKTGNIRGIEFSVCFLTGMLCLIYSVGILLLDRDNDTKLMSFGIFITGIIICVICFMYIYSQITRRERMEKRRIVLNMLKKDIIKLKGRLEAEEKEFEKYFNIIKDSVSRMYLWAYENGEGTKEIIDTVINEKVKKAEAFNIKISVRRDIGTDVSVKPMDAVSVIANLFDNAIEAAANQEVVEGENEDRFINADIKAYGEDFYLLMENSYSGEILRSGSRLVTTKKDKENHGMGISNVSEIVRRYGKTMDIQTENRIFRVEIR